MTFAKSKYKKLCQKLLTMLNNSIFENFIEKKNIKHMMNSILQSFEK